MVKEGPCEEDSQFASVCGFMRRSGANIEHRGGGGSKKSEDEFAFLDHVWHEPILDGYWKLPRTARGSHKQTNNRAI